MGANPVSLRRAFLTHTALTAVVSLLLWCAIWFKGDYDAFRVEIEGMRTAHLDNQKAMLRQQVGEVVKYVQYMHGRTEERLRSALVHRVQDACDIAGNIHSEYAGSRRPDEIQKMIRDALRPIRFNNGRGYYFAFSMDGIEQLFADRPELEGPNMLEVRGPDGKSVVGELIRLLAGRENAFHEYQWTKPDDTGLHTKVAYVQRFEPYDWVIGTGEYLEDAEAEVRDEVLGRLVTLRFGGEGYFFGSTYDYEPLFSNGVITRGTESLFDLTDPHGVKIIQEHRKAVENPDGGFVEYAWRKLDAPTPVPKISYVRGVPEWRWIVGAGVYLDTIEEQIVQRQAAHRTRALDALRRGVLTLLVLLAAIIYWARRVAGRTDQSIAALSTFFREAATASATIDPDRLHFSEFRSIARSANNMLAARIEAEAALRDSQERLRQARKMEELGTLAGGIAHDFNNVLAGMVSYMEMASDSSESPDAAKQHIECALQGAERARELVRQILVFSRRSEHELVPLSIGPVVREAMAMVRASTPSSVTIEQSMNAAPDTVMGDATQIHEIVLNLCVNAVHAMADSGGLLRVETANVDLPVPRRPDIPEGVKAGPFVELSVRDTGVGIEPSDQVRVFDPYFTTKGPDGGSGMGLAAVHGIVQGHGGFIELESEPGQGTVFRVYLPITDEAPEEAVSVVAQTTPRGHERILFVDDEVSLSRATGLIIKGLGYDVVVMNDSQEALELFRAAPRGFDLVITDQTMPKLTGERLAEEIQKLGTGTPVVLCTGDTYRLDAERTGRVGISFTAMKPLRKAELASLIRKAIDGRQA